MNSTIKETDETATVLANATHYLKMMSTAEKLAYQVKENADKEAQKSM